MSSRSGDMGPGCMALFGLPFLGAGLFVIGLFASAFLDWQRAKEWDRVPVTIEGVELKSHRGSKGSVSWSVEARYSYEAGGRGHTGTRVSPDVGSSSDSRHRERYEELKRHHDSGEPFRAWVNPAVTWTLSVSAATPGVDFKSEFPLPVFRVEDENLIERRPPGAE